MKRWERGWKGVVVPLVDGCKGGRALTYSHAKPKV